MTTSILYSDVGGDCRPSEGNINVQLWMKDFEGKAMEGGRLILTRHAAMPLAASLFQALKEEHKPTRGELISFGMARAKLAREPAFNG